MFLLIGDHTDPHLQELCTEINQAQECQILSTERDDLLDTQFSFFSKTDGTYSCIISQSEKTINLDNIDLAFCLSPLFRLDGKEQTQKARFWYFSWKESLYGFYALLALRNRFINGSIENCLRCQSKILTFPFAHQAGLKVPKSLISNAESSIKDFFAHDSQVVLKTLHQMPLESEGEMTMLLTQKILEQDFSSYEEQDESPLFLQKFIDKIYDLRLVVIGSEVMTCKIDASKSLFGNVDYRAYDMPNTPHHYIETPSELRNKILSLCKMMSLDYVSIDLCVDSTQEYWLLDINPFGRYLWLEYATGMQITRKLSKFIQQKVD